jgi:hypothetical protein
VAVWTFNKVSKMRELYIQPSGSAVAPTVGRFPVRAAEGERQ